MARSRSRSDSEALITTVTRSGLRCAAAIRTRTPADRELGDLISVRGSPCFNNHVAAFLLKLTGFLQRFIIRFKADRALTKTTWVRFVNPLGRYVVDNKDFLAFHFIVASRGRGNGVGLAVFPEGEQLAGQVRHPAVHQRSGKVVGVFNGGSFHSLQPAGEPSGLAVLIDPVEH